MRALSPIVAVSAAAFALVAPALAQDSSMHGHDVAAVQLPQACQAGQMPAMHGMEEMSSMTANMNEHQKAYMESMMQAEGPMMRGMMAEDADVAFACAMIPHHQSAIDMAKVDLQHGDDDEMKQMAQKIIDDQTREIGELIQLIEELAP